MEILTDNAERVFIASAHTRCDSCSAEARAAVELDETGDLVLYFCHHHLRLLEDRFLDLGYTIYEDVLT